MVKVNLNQPVTKGMLNEAVDAILEGMNELYSKHDHRFDNVDSRLDKVDHRLDKIEGDVYFIKRNVKDIKIDLVYIPTKKEFSDLKRQVDTLQS